MNHEDIKKAFEALAIIEKEYDKSYTVSDLAQMVGTNRNTLNNACKKITGLPVKTYVIFFRVKKAKDLLVDTGLPIEVIARRVGWHRSNLDNHFKKITGKSPKDWRSDPDIK